MVATFNHPNDTSLAAVSHLVNGDIEDNDFNYLEHFDSIMLKELPEDVLDLMDMEDIEHYAF